MHLTPFRRFLAASGMTNLADGVATLVWAWLATLLTRDPVLVAAVPVALRLPWFLLALPAGVAADRVDRLRLVLAMDALRAVVYAGVAAAVWLALPLAPAPAEGLAEPVLFGLVLAGAVLVGGAEVFRDNAAQTMLPALVPRDGLERANGRMGGVEMVGNTLVGPPLGAALIAVALPLPFLLNAVALGLAILLVRPIEGAFRPPAAPRHWRRDLAEGVRFLLDAPMLRLLAVVSGLWNMLFQMMSIGLLLHAQENLGLDAPRYGLVLAAAAGGGILGSLAGEGLVRRFGPARVAQVTLAASAAGFAAIALAPGAVTLGLSLAAFEFAGLAWNVVSISYRQRAVPDRLRGRVNSVYRMLAWGMMPVGLLLGGAIVRLADGPLPRAEAVTMPLWAAVAGGLMLALLAWRRLGAAAWR